MITQLPRLPADQTIMVPVDAKYAVTCDLHLRGGCVDTRYAGSYPSYWTAKLAFWGVSLLARFEVSWAVPRAEVSIYSLSRE